MAFIAICAKRSSGEVRGTSAIAYHHEYLSQFVDGIFRNLCEALLRRRSRNKRLRIIMNIYPNLWMYNAGRKEFAKLPEFVSGSKPASFSAEPLPVEITCDGQGVFCFRLEGQTHEKAWLCASPQLSGTPVCDWTNTDNGSTWQLVTVPMADAQHAYATANAMVDFAADKGGFDIANTVSSLSEVANDQAYTIKNSSGLGVIYSNPNQSNVWLGESSNETFAAAVNRFSENSMWFLIEHAGQHLLYNIGRKQFLCIPAFDVVSQPCTF